MKNRQTGLREKRQLSGRERREVKGDLKGVEGQAEGKKERGAR